jgi:hypothetical protein
MSKVKTAPKKPNGLMSCCKQRVGEPHLDDCPTFPKPPQPARPMTDAERGELATRLARSEVNRLRLQAMPTEADKADWERREEKRRFDCESLNIPYVYKSPTDGGGAAGGPGRAPTSAVVVKDEQVEVTQGQKGGRRYDLFGHPVTAVIRWMGKAGWDKAKAKKGLAKMGIECSDTTVGIQLRAGAAGNTDRGDPAVLTPGQAAQLEEAAK